MSTWTDRDAVSHPAGAVPGSGRVGFDIEDVPFSTRGAWTDLSPVVGLHRRAADVHLVSHRNGLAGVLRLVPSDAAGTPVTAERRADSSTFRWSVGPHDVTAVFDGPDVLRIRGRGMHLRIEDAAEVLTPFTGTFLTDDPATDTLQFCSYETGMRYRITVLAGTVEAHDVGTTGRAERWVRTVGGPWELVVQEIRTAEPAFTADRSFDEAVAAADTAFDAYRQRHAGWATADTPAAGLATYVLWSGTVAPDGYLRREAVLMSKHWMDKVWSWDHCFNALALVRGDPRAAVDQFLLPFDHRDDTGALPDSIAHSEVLHNFVKPPIHGWASSTLHREAPLDRAESRAVYDGVAAWTRFWLDHRRAPGHVLPYYAHGNDSGWDNATTFDGDRLIESPDLAAFLVLQLEELERLGDLLGEAEDVERWAAERVTITAALLDLWDGGHFRARSVRSGARSGTSSLLTALPIVLGRRLPDRILEPLVRTVESHLTRWGPATERPDSPAYEADGYWRGPVWAPSTVLVEHGLRAAGRDDVADRVRDAFLELCETNGFAENFDALTGVGQRDRAYTWTASAYLLFAHDRAVDDARRPPHAERARTATGRSTP